MESSGSGRRGRRARRAHRARRPRRPLLSAALAVLAMGGVTAGGTVYVTARAHSGAGAVSSASSPSAPSSAPAGEEASAVESTARPVVDREALLRRSMAAVAVPPGARVSAAVLEPGSGESGTYGTDAFDTASIVKVDILATLLLQAQDAGREPTSAERAYATKMIENSDNASATALWHAIGRAGGLDAANERFGLAHTSGGDGELWGLTRTTAADQLLLLRQVFGEESELSAASRAYVRELMGAVQADQQWGVSAAGSSWELKNGWLPRSATGLWDVNSIGRVTVDGTRYLVAVLSCGTTTRAEGISLVEAAAKAAVSAFARDGSAASPGPRSTPAGS
ncbi:class A beta-lactamase-related serine hydrolase [Streptomyces cellostaticus]|uniref:class A beta-lactamase-related serine hydrolase n=1 Tax=Streptomyces cellostaticus TaxID=67285 RepID=UPI002026744C|nr:class A beta-lactamase-related serine hydrolase [Streptomyces cellostaticus]